MSDEKKPLPAETSAQEAPEKEEPKKGFSLFGQLHKVSPQQQAINEKNAKHKKELQDDLALKKAAWLKDQARRQNCSCERRRQEDSRGRLPRG
jgi:hypothetical protein